MYYNDLWMNDCRICCITDCDKVEYSYHEGVQGLMRVVRLNDRLMFGCYLYDEYVETTTIPCY